jgi:uncharacterized protein YqgV (UPF0045/DUF77 family)
MRVSALYGLYPLGGDAYMSAIYDVIERAKRDPKLGVTPVHFATRLDGELDDVLRVIRESFEAPAHGHVVVHATISAGSPTREKGGAP